MATPAPTMITIDIREINITIITGLKINICQQRKDSKSLHVTFEIKEVTKEVIYS
jgi:hypothetical protein